MSRVGKKPIVIPSGVDVGIDYPSIAVKGPKGSLSIKVGRGISVKKIDQTIQIGCDYPSDKQCRANFGTARALIANMVAGVSTGWKKSLEMTGVGFSAKLNGSKLVLNVGFSHEVELEVPSGVVCSVGKTSVALEGCDKSSLSNFAAKVRSIQPPEPYLGKGIRYSDETIRRKAGKTGKK
jgi:large subunit ribosomal protein L6